MCSQNSRWISIRNNLITAILLAVSTCGYAGSSAPAEVEIQGFKFIPQEITVKAGTVIRWSNREKRQYHSVWFEQAGDPEAAYFFPGESYERSFDKPGVYPYHCGPHPEMTGTVTVE